MAFTAIPEPTFVVAKLNALGTPLMLTSSPLDTPLKDAAPTVAVVVPSYVLLFASTVIVKGVGATVVKSKVVLLVIPT